MSEERLESVLSDRPGNHPSVQNEKIAGLIACALVFILGLTSFIYKARYEGGVLTCFREMTVDGTVFTSLTSFALVWLNLYELKEENPRTSNFLYFWRLSSAVTELMILFIVLLGYTPDVPGQAEAAAL